MALQDTAVSRDRAAGEIGSSWTSSITGKKDRHLFMICLHFQSEF